MVDGLYLFGAFLVFRLLKAVLQHSSAFTHSQPNSKVASLQSANLLIKNTNTHIHTPMEQLLGVMWGSVSCPRFFFLSLIMGFFMWD